MMYVDHSGSKHNIDCQIMHMITTMHLSTVLTSKLEHAETHAATKCAWYVMKNLSQ